MLSPSQPLTPRRVLAVVSHPRSGTHLTLDFIRRNFPAFNQRVSIWERASMLYVSLDDRKWKANLHEQASRSDSLLLQSHLAGVEQDVTRSVTTNFIPPDVQFIYPFRSFSATMRSFAAFSEYLGPVHRFLDEQNDFFSHRGTVETCARRHAGFWLEQRDVIFLNIKKLIADPDHAAKQLGAALDLEPASRTRRLPRQKRFYGKLAEMHQRLTGRESTEVKVHHNRPWSFEREAELIDNRFADLYAPMLQRSIL